MRFQLVPVVLYFLDQVVYSPYQHFLISAIMTLTEQLSILQQTFPFLEAEDLDLLMKHGKYRQVANREIIIHQGESRKIIFFILSGMTRGYYVTPSGDEKNLFIRPERTFTGAPDSLFSDSPTRYTFEAIQETHLLIFRFEDIESLAKTHPNIAQVYILALKANLQTLVYRVESLVLNTPEERYESLLERSPEFFKNAFLKHIANYLGITPVSLSRIMKRRRSGN